MCDPRNSTKISNHHMAKIRHSIVLATLYKIGKCRECTIEIHDLKRQTFIMWRLTTTATAARSLRLPTSVSENLLFSYVCITCHLIYFSICIGIIKNKVGIYIVLNTELELCVILISYLFIMIFLNT